MTIAEEAHELVAQGAARSAYDLILKKSGTKAEVLKNTALLMVQMRDDQADLGRFMHYVQHEETL